MQPKDFEAFLEAHQLPASYLDQAFTHYQILIDDVLSRLSNKRPLVLGINGCQGSGKSTTAAFLQHAFETRYQLNVVNISLDDFYLSKAARQEKAKHLHPLFATRGVPGTHDIQLALNTMAQLLKRNTPLISRFNKATDDLFPIEQWDRASEEVDIIILEGWCLSAQAEDEASLLAPINALEQMEDSNGVWRKHVNQQLSTDYAKLFKLIDCLVMLKAPSFNTVFTWRLEQEKKLAKKLLSSGQEHSGTSGLMSEADIQTFVQYFQRLTENMLREMPERADHCYFLNKERQIVHEQHKSSDFSMANPDIH